MAEGTFEQAPVPSSEQSWDMALAEKLTSSAVAGRALAEMAETDERIVVLTTTRPGEPY